MSGKNLIFKFVRKISFRRLQHCSDELWWKRIPLFLKLLEKLVRKATLICWAHTIKLGPWYQQSYDTVCFVEHVWLDFLGYLLAIQASFLHS